MILSVKPENPYILFFVSTGMLVLLLCFVAFICPEPLEKKSVPLPEEPSLAADTRRRRRSLSSFLKSGISELIAGLITPISIFIPRTITNFEGNRKKDWNLTFAVGALFLYSISIVSYYPGPLCCSTHSTLYAFREYSQSSTCMPSIYTHGQQAM